MKTCCNCGKEVENYSWSNYCDECAGDAWDRSFEGTSQNAYEIGFRELVDKLKNSPNPQIEIREIITTWGALDWNCPACGNLRLDTVEAKKLNIEQQVSVLIQPCRCSSLLSPLPVPPLTFY